MSDPLGPAKRLRYLLDAAGVVGVGLRSVRGVLEITFTDATSERDRTTAETVFAGFKQDDADAQAAWEAERENAADAASIDAGTPTAAALLAVSLESAKGGAEADILARAKARLATDRAEKRDRRGAVRGGRP